MCLVLSRHAVFDIQGQAWVVSSAGLLPHFTDGVFEACLGQVSEEAPVPHTVLIPVIYLPKASERTWLSRSSS